jgi:predicted DNA-binding protein with PD1-like motif
MVTTTGYPAVEHFEVWDDKPLELSAISGLIADGQAHIHMVVSDKNVAYSGHCEPGCKILYLCEVVIAEIPDGNFKRVKDEHGINQLVGIDE